MPDFPQPTTGHFNVNPLSSIVLPHAETHAPGGNDPITQSVRFISTTDTTALYNVTSSYATVTGATTTFISRGGRLRIVFSGPRGVRIDGDANNLFGTLYIRAVIDSTNLSQYPMHINVQPTVVGTLLKLVRLYESGALIWYTAVASGKHTVTIQAYYTTGAGTVSATVATDPENGAIHIPCTLSVEEILPVRAE